MLDGGCSGADAKAQLHVSRPSGIRCDVRGQGEQGKKKKGTLHFSLGVQSVQ